MRWTACLVGLGLLGLGVDTEAGIEDGRFGLRWGQSADEARLFSDTMVVSWSIHQRYGQSFEVDRLPLSVGGEIHRILYFNEKNELLRVWVNFGHPGEELWEENYLLDDAVAKYRSLKAKIESGGDTGQCREPELVFVRKDEVEVLAPHFERDRDVWSCAFRDDDTELELALRRLGDARGERFDVTIDTQDARAVAAYRAAHPLRGFGHGGVDPAVDLEGDAAGSHEVDCEVATAGDRSTMDTSPFALLYRRICEYEAEPAEEMPRFDEVILLD